MLPARFADETDVVNGEVRLWGDPFCTDGTSRQLRELLTVASVCGWRCGLCISSARGADAGREIELTDGSRVRRVHTQLSDDELEPVWRAVERPVSASAPLLVWGTEDDVREAALEYPLASAVRAAVGVDPRRLLGDVVASRRDAATDPSPAALDERELAPFAELSGRDGVAGHFLHPVETGRDSGTDLAVRAVARAGGRLTVLLPAPDPDFEKTIRVMAEDVPGSRPFELDFRIGALSPARLARVGAVLMPVRKEPQTRTLLAALASGRPVVVSRFAATAGVLNRPGICVPIGGKYVKGEFEPDASALEHEITGLLERPDEGREIAARARRHVLERHRRPMTTAPRATPRSSRATVVLEAPLFEMSSASILTEQTARAIHRRGRVDLHLVPVAPFDKSLSWFAQRAPDLAPLLTRRPPEADLWLSAGWPPRPDRPPARCFAVRLDWEYGALPVELTPLVTEEADLVVVHSRAVERMVAAAGRSTREIVRIPHGVDPDLFHEAVEPDGRVLAFKGDRPAILFVGGLIWRKGIDLLLSVLLRAARGPGSPVLVVKASGGDKAYAGYHLGELVERVRAHPQGPDLLLLDDDLGDREMASIYAACDLLVHPYRGEGFGMPVLEARACGLPVVVTRGGSTDDFCSDGVSLGVHAERRVVDLPGAHVGRPWVLEPDPAALSAVMQTALQELPARRAAARVASAAVRSEFSWDAAAAEIERLAFSALASCAARQPQLV